MTSRRTVLAASALTLSFALLLASCFIPQPVPEYAAVDGGATVTPPRIIVDSVTPAGTTLQIRRGCPGGATLTFGAVVRDENTLEQVEARWFVDYSAQPPGSLPYRADIVPPPEDTTQTDRTLPTFTLTLPAADAEAFHVIELVTSNGFYALYDPAAPEPNRSAQPGFETQLFRWLVEYVDAATAPCQVP